MPNPPRWPLQASTQLSGTGIGLRCLTERPSASAARPIYKVSTDRPGPEAEPALRHDSYKFDLSSRCDEQGGRISGTGTEASRNIFGNLQGTAGGGRIEVFVEANGFAANLTLRHHQTSRPCRSTPRRDPGREHHHGEG